MQAWSVLYQGEARLIEEAVAAWGAEPDDPARLQLAEELAGAVIHLAEALGRWHKSLWELLFANQVRTTQQTGRFFLDCVHASLKACDDVLACLQSAGSGNGLAGRVAQVVEARARLATMEQSFSRRWPFLDSAALQLGQAEIERGEFVTAEDIRRELQG